MSEILLPKNAIFIRDIVLLYIGKNQQKNAAPVLRFSLVPRISLLVTNLGNLRDWLSV